MIAHARECYAVSFPNRLIGVVFSVLCTGCDGLFLRTRALATFHPLSPCPLLAGICRLIYCLSYESTEGFCSQFCGLPISFVDGPVLAHRCLGLSSTIGFLCYQRPALPIFSSTNSPPLTTRPIGTRCRRK